MAKVLKKKFFEIEIPIINEKYEAQAGAIEDLNNKTIKVDASRKLKGKSVDLVFKIKVKEGKAIAIPKKLNLLPSFIKHMMHGGISYVEDSIVTETNENQVIIKPFLITRKKVSRAVRRTLRNSAKNWIIDYIKTKTNDDTFQEILSNQLQKALSQKLKKIYPLAICEIRVFEIKEPIEKKSDVKEEKKENIKEVNKVEKEVKEENREKTVEEIVKETTEPEKEEEKKEQEAKEVKEIREEKEETKKSVEEIVRETTEPEKEEEKLKEEKKEEKSKKPRKRTSKLKKNSNN